MLRRTAHCHVRRAGGTLATVARHLARYESTQIRSTRQTGQRRPSQRLPEYVHVRLDAERLGRRCLRRRRYVTGSVVVALSRRGWRLARQVRQQVLAPYQASFPFRPIEYFIVPFLVATLLCHLTRLLDTLARFCGLNGRLVC